MVSEQTTWAMAHREWRQKRDSFNASISRLPEFERTLAMITAKLDRLVDALKAAPPKQRNTGQLKLGDGEGSDKPGGLSSCQGEPEKADHRRPSPAVTQPAPVRAFPASPARSQRRASALYAAQSGKSVQNSSSRPAMPFRRPSDTELMARRERGLCYRCDDRFFLGHWCKANDLRELVCLDEELLAEVQHNREEEAPRVNQKFALLQPTGPGPGVRATWANRIGLNSPSFLSTQLSSKPRPTMVFFSNVKRSAATQPNSSPVPVTIGVSLSGLADHTRCKTPSEMKQPRCSETTERLYLRRLLSQMELVRLNCRNFTCLPEYLLESQFLTGQRSEVRTKFLVLRPSGLDCSKEVTQRVEDKIWIILQAGPDLRIEGRGRVGQSGVGPGPGVKEPEPPKPGWAPQQPSHWPRPKILPVNPVRVGSSLPEGDMVTMNDYHQARVAIPMHQKQ